MPKGMSYNYEGNKATNPSGPDKDLPKVSKGMSKTNSKSNPTTNPSGPDRPLPMQAVNVSNGTDSYNTSNPSMPDRPLPKVG